MPTIRDVVQALSRRPGVQAAIVLGQDGLPIDSAVRDGVDAEGVAALVPPVVAACGSLGHATACGGFGASAMEFDSGIALVATLTPDALLALVVDPGTNVGALLYEVRRHRSAIAGLL
jgi:predicted regulator of Ras-like GTPase activity (Roadblock/LC7/MglB family)